MILAGLGKSTAYSLYQILWHVIDLVYPPTCIGCGEINQRLCSTCLREIQFIEGDLCPICGEPSNKGRICSSCRANPPYYRNLRGIAHYSGPVRESIIKLKYESDYGLAEELAKLLIAGIKKLDWDIHLVTSVPLNKTKIRERGYNQADLLARPIAYAFSIPFRPDAIFRIKNTRSQVGLSSSDRIENLKDAFRADSGIVKNKNVLIVDDVTTTGTTINECARAMVASGAVNVYGMTLARPLHENPGNEL